MGKTVSDLWREATYELTVLPIGFRPKPKKRNKSIELQTLKAKQKT